MSQPPGPLPPDEAPIESRDEAPIESPVAQLQTVHVLRWGLALWAIALLVLLLVPSLREGGRDWWVWVPVAALVLGGVGHTYLARGRGTAADA